MLQKPFKPPLLSRKPVSSPPEDFQPFPCPPAKRLKLDESNSYVQESRAPSSLPSQRSEKQDEPSTGAEEAYYNVLWRKPTAKKHKTWDGDGTLCVVNCLATLYDVSGRSLGSTRHSTPLFTGSGLFIAGKEVEVESSISREEYFTRKPFTGAAGKPTVRELDEELRTNIKFNSKTVSKPSPKPYSKPLSKVKEEKPQSAIPIQPASRSVSDVLKTQFKNPQLEKDTRPSSNGKNPTPRFDPNDPGALVMKRIRTAPNEMHTVDIVVDPIITKHLRDHQREGVKFMYDCVMGLKPKGVNGAILADEMGLGKTLQVIALIWTLLKQNPVFEDPPVVKKAVVVCPATVIKNWKKEFRKWLGDRIGVFILDGQKARLKDFTHGRAYHVMIVGYERLRTIQAELQKCTSIDLVIADEGHRLKTANNKSAQAIKALPTDRRVLLSGTPLQNDLSEFYFAADMVNPGLLSKASTFKREFETPIMRSRQPDATDKEIEKGEARSAELAELTSMFMLRRTSEILSKYLPPKTESILFCRPTSIQAQVYRAVLSSPAFGAVLYSTETAFKLIDALKKLCNSPNLLMKKRESEDVAANENLASLLSDVPSSLLKWPGASGKLQVLDSLLHIIRTTTDEKVVIVSHYTSTLDIIGGLLESLSYTHLRLDGTTPTSKRQGLVDRFNRSDSRECFAFLFSAKSGGAGINLIGASRLILFDVDWNPSTDEQAMARIHRDGQKRHCWIYRLLTQGALDEKIFQRQVAKRALAEAVVDGKVSSSTFTAEELRKLFQLDESEKCQTHELLGCPCEGNGKREGDNEPSLDAEDGTALVDDDSDDELPELPTLMQASAIDMTAQEEKIKQMRRSGRYKSDKDRMLALMQYEHISTRTSNATELIEKDDVLKGVLEDTEHKVGYIFTKTKHL